MNHMVVSSSDWTGYNDGINYRELVNYCMVSSVCFINIIKPYYVDKDYEDECVIVKLATDNEPSIRIIIYV